MPKTADYRLHVFKTKITFKPRMYIMFNYKLIESTQLTVEWVGLMNDKAQCKNQ